MAEKSQNLIVAMFVLVGLAILGGLIVAFGGGRTLFVSTYDLQVEFSKGVQSVQQGQTVTLYGKRIGETRDVKFVDDSALEKGVIVIVKVEGVDLPSSLEMVVTPNLMGLGKPPIELFVRNPADKTKLPRDGSARIPGRMLPTLDQLIPKEMQTNLSDASKHIGELADRLKPVAENINRMLEARKLADVDAKATTANLDSVIQRFDASLKAFSAVVGSPENQQNFAILLANSRKISETGVATMENVRDITADGKQVAKDVGQLVRKLATVSDNLSSMLKQMDTMLVAMNQKEGTAGLLLNDNRLYEELLLSARRLTKTLDDMREVLDLAKKGQLRIKAF